MFDENLNEMVEIQLLNVTGQILIKEQFQAVHKKSLVLNAGELSSGVYMLQVTGKHSVKTSRVIVK